MITALLDAVVQAILEANLRYDARTCGKTFPDGSPPPVAGDIYVGVHQGTSQSTADNSLDERLGFSVTITMRATNMPYDRIPDQLIAKTRLAQKLATELGLDSRADQLRALLHMNWAVIGRANNNLIASLQGVTAVYGFCEPARFRNMEVPVLKGGEWWQAEEGEAIGVKSELRFEGARRLQAIGTFV